jgi:hypothetical protein
MSRRGARGAIDMRGLVEIDGDRLELNDRRKGSSCDV